MTTRRKFLTILPAIGLAATLPLEAKAEKKLLIHHVYFWLKNPASKEDLNKLIEAVNTLKQIETLRMVRIGVPAPTQKRDVIDDSYSVSLLTAFDDVKGHDVYQGHPIHVKFVETNSYLWNKVVVYDSMDV